MTWWIARPGTGAAGPVSTELLLRGISGGKVPDDAVVCRVGDSEWRLLATIPRFSDAFKARRERRQFNLAAERTRWDPSFFLTEPVAPHRLERYGHSNAGRLEREVPTYTERRPLTTSEPPPMRGRGGEDRR